MKYEPLVTHRQAIPDYIINHLVYTAGTTELLAISDLVDDLLKPPPLTVKQEATNKRNRRNFRQKAQNNDIIY